MSDELRFDDLTPQQIPVSVGGKDYVLHEATGDVACNYRNAMLRCTELGPDGKPRKIVGLADTEPMLVAMCLKTKEGRDVAVSTIRSWPPRVIKALYRKAKEISELDDVDENLEELQNQRADLDKRIADMQDGSGKNPLTDTMDGSD